MLENNSIITFDFEDGQNSLEIDLPGNSMAESPARRERIKGDPSQLHGSRDFDFLMLYFGGLRS